MIDVTPYLIAGGQSQRMGQDKRLLMLDGRSLLQRQADLLGTVVGTPATLVGEIPHTLLPAGTRRLNDAKPGCGPLGGIVAALQDCKTTWALILAVDLPGIQAADIEVLLSQRASPAAVITLSQRGMPEPLAALYASEYRDNWLEQLTSGPLKIRVGMDRLGYRLVSLPEESTALLNINRPGDWERFVSIHNSRESSP